MFEVQTRLEVTDNRVIILFTRIFYSLPAYPVGIADP